MKSIRATTFCFLSILALSVCAIPSLRAQDQDQDQGQDRPAGPTDGQLRQRPPLWSLTVQGGLMHQFDADFDNGGSVSVDRVSTVATVNYKPAPKFGASMFMSYGFDNYHFSGNTGFGALDPWSQIHSLGVGGSIRKGLDDNWTVMGGAKVRFSAERSADPGDALTAGGWIGAAYRVNDRLTIGPGIGVASMIEDNPDVFPILIINWKITDELTMSTGGGFAATLGPGVVVRWKPTNDWSFALGGRSEKTRFRLNDQGVVPDGVGQETGTHLYASVTRHFGRHGQVSLAAGMKADGELRLENDNGDRIAKDDFDPATFLLLYFRWEF